MSTNQSLVTVLINNEIFFKISDVNKMRHFFMSIVSDSNHWLFLSSNGGISAGRKNSEYALFPYYTDDKITDTAEITGSKTIVRIVNNDSTILWEPFSVRSEGRFDITRNLYQNQYSNKVIFEEINNTLELIFCYEWNSSNQFGFVKRSTIQNIGTKAIAFEIVDGLQNVLPYGVPSDLQTKASNLADAYKRSELMPNENIGIFALSAIIVDKAEPSEALKANVVWQLGIENTTHLLSSLQLQAFRNGESLVQETDVKGEKGAYFIATKLLLQSGEKKQWNTICNVNQTVASVIALSDKIKSDKSLLNQIEEDIELGTANLIKLASSADALQFTNDNLKDTRHFSNVLFNIMRGGIFDNNYQIEKWDFDRYLQKANKQVFENVKSNLDKLGDLFTSDALIALANQSNDTDFIRLATEYLPLKFSRRHGDPSRPWNQFSINTKSEIDGSKILDYQGNWRDIFQNWEALAHSYPAFIEGMIYKFLNASTFDGYNPYRVTKDGFDWETIEPDNPWSYIGYWGDHQIIYLLKFLEFAEQKNAGAIATLLLKNNFVYANVPYKIKSYNSIVKNPKDTIEFDHSNESNIHHRIKEYGADGALLTNANNEIYHVNFIEKILATVLSKLSNLVPEGGIWMNTQRPEWNDANNALVGNGLSMVTLYYLRRFLKLFEEIFDNVNEKNVEVSIELQQLFTSIYNTFNNNSSLISSSINNADRKKITDELGHAGSEFRDTIYAQKFSGKKKEISVASLQSFVKISLQFLEHSILANKRKDGLYHAYNLLTYNSDGIEVSYLSEMLEGQVGVLSSKFLQPQESLELLNALQASSLYRKDQNSYILYPNKNLLGFLQRNNIPKNLFESSVLLTTLLQQNNTSIAEIDVQKNYHFNGNFKNADDVAKALNELPATYQALVSKEKNLILEIFESVFNHKEFTGRSGTFYGYEGLGSIYWHMVSKLLLAVQETCLGAFENNADAQTIHALVTHYYNINDGIGVHKSPNVYGAFPITPYSHTPFNKGAQQPGMTGQVKEDILCRIGELGVSFKGGELVFNPQLLKGNEFLTSEKTVSFVLSDGTDYQLNLEKNSLAFSVCQVPVVYKKSAKNTIQIEMKDGLIKTIDGNVIAAEYAKQIIHRNGQVKNITVCINENTLQ